MAGRGDDMEPLSPRDANARAAPRVAELKIKAAAQLKATKDKEHPPPPPPQVTEPPSADRRDGAVYQVDKLLGKGGFAICHEARLAGTRKKVALKIVKSKMPTKMEQKFQTELQIHSKMRQRNIVQFFRAFTFDNCTYLVLELCPNGSLMDMVKRRKGLTEPEVRFYTVQIAGAIKYMHARGIIHRDLKMGNIFLDKNMNAKIGDFGLAALLVTGRDMQTMRRTTLCGTPNYIAPEILEKGKKGHDHMVDMWSLGIIVFAMLTSKPPFQSSTTDEIYRRAREREYEWPSSETCADQISQDAKELVATMLVEADNRPEPDVVVQHPFFTAGYVPVPADITQKLRDGPLDVEALSGRDSDAAAQLQNVTNLKALCEECGVGPWASTRIGQRAVWREMAAEEAAGLTPAIPLAEKLVYRPFEDWQREANAMADPIVPATLALAAASTKPDEVGAVTVGVPSGLLKAPPQSFAAQQRAQGRKTSNTVTLRPLQQPASVDTLTKGMAPQRLPRVKRDVSKLGPRTTERLASAENKYEMGTLRRQPTLAKTQATPAEAESTPMADNAVSARAGVSARENIESLFGPSDHPHAVPGTQHEAILQRLQKLQAELDRALNARSMALMSAKDKTPSLPHIVVKWVDYTNKFGMGYTLNDGGVGCVLRQIPVHEGPQSAVFPPLYLLIRGAERHFGRKRDPSYRDRHQMIPMTEPVSFYEYNGEEGLACTRVSAEEFRVPINADGTAGRISTGNDVYDRRKKERVVLWKKFANYMVAYGREIEGQTPAADKAHAPAPETLPTQSDSAAAPSDVVSFYQRFGDVGCWMFCDGHLQFNFPDHTKIVLDATGTWCHFWHLPQAAAEQLATKGTLDEAALDDRTVLSYPVQTLLNFATAPKQPAAASRATGARSTSNPGARRRPEISPELQGIPAANDFRRKIEYIRSVVREWVANGGLGNSDLSPARRQRWQGVRETRFVQPQAKRVWVTIGARWGDDRFADEPPRTAATTTAPGGEGGGESDSRKRSA